MKTIPDDKNTDTSTEVFPVRHLLYCPVCATFQRSDMVSVGEDFKIICSVCGGSERFVRHDDSWFPAGLDAQLTKVVRGKLLRRIVEVVKRGG